MAVSNPQTLIEFWFARLEPKDWWVGGDHVDALVVERFGATVDTALNGELYSWRSTAVGRLAEILCLDQFTRNMFRGTAKAFAGDSLALILSQEAVLGGHDKTLSNPQKSFLYMPLMHSESLKMHEFARQLFAAPGFETNLKALDEHTEVLRKFGRYPSRNKALGRISTSEELNYLNKNGKTWGQG